MRPNQDVVVVKVSMSVAGLVQGNDWVHDRLGPLLEARPRVGTAATMLEGKFQKGLASLYQTRDRVAGNTAKSGARFQQSQRLGHGQAATP